MKNNFAKTILIFLLTLNFSYGEENVDVDKIIEHYIENIGGIKNIKAIDNLVYSSGTYQEGNFTGNGAAAMSLARPYFKLVGDKNNQASYMEGYDGSAWEYYNDPGVVIRTVGAPSEAIRHYAGVEHPLVNYKDKGSVAEFIDLVEFEGKNTFVIKLIRMDGLVELFYIDQDTYELRASSAELPIHAFGEAVAQITKISDYRNIGGMLIAHRFQSVQLPEGNVLSSMQWGRVEANKELPDNWFSPPEFKRTDLQQFSENLYEQRSDINSMMWTYIRFRKSHPELNTSEMSNFAGFQMLKMGNTASAITLLEQNIKDYPESSDAHFELGRAYLSANRTDAAQIQLHKALEIDPENIDAKRALNQM